MLRQKNDQTKVMFFLEQLFTITPHPFPWVIVAMFSIAVKFDLFLEKKFDGIFGLFWKFSALFFSLCATTGGIWMFERSVLNWLIFNSCKRIAETVIGLSVVFFSSSRFLLPPYDVRHFVHSFAFCSFVHAISTELRAWRQFFTLRDFGHCRY